jgi:peptide/nickel transport system substrate-binding protein
VDPERGVVTGVYTLGADDEPVALAVSAGDVWVANRRARTVARIDPDRTVGTEEFRLGHDPRALAVVDGRLWVAVAATGAGQRGGTLRVDYQGEGEGFEPDKYDPATSYVTWGWQVLSTTNDGLTTYRRVGGNAGNTLLPDLAESLPTASDGGLTYAFKLREGVRFSTGRLVRPSDVKRGIERSLHAEQRAYGLLAGIGSITADDGKGTIVFRLKRADPDFLHRLALPFAAAVPPGTPAPPAIVPGTGPYRIVEFKPGRHIRLERNRFYRQWSALARPDGYPDTIDARLNVEVGEAVEAVRARRREVTDLGSGYAELARLRRRDPGPIRDTVGPATTWIFLNTHVPPFDKVDARRAVSLVINRRAVVAAAGHKDVVTCHIIPPSLPGYRPDCPQGGPDLARARRLIARSGTRGARVTLWTGGGYEPMTPMLTRALHSLGYQTSVRRLGFDSYFARVADSATRAQIGPNTWGADYPSTSTFLELFACRSFVPHSADNSNLSRFCDPRADDLMRRASALQTADPRAADALWAKAEHRVLAAVPAIPVLNPVHTDLVSTRVRNDQYHPQWGLLLDQVSVR